MSSAPGAALPAARSPHLTSFSAFAAARAAEMKGGPKLRGRHLLNSRFGRQPGARPRCDAIVAMSYASFKPARARPENQRPSQ